MRFFLSAALPRGRLSGFVEPRSVVVDLVAVLEPVAVVGAEIPAVRVKIALVLIDVTLIVPHGLAGAPEIRPVLLHGGHVARRFVLAELSLVLADRLPVAVTVLPIGAKVWYQSVLLDTGASQLYLSGTGKVEWK